MHNHDIWLSNKLEFWRHMKWSGYLNIELFDMSGNQIYEVNDYKRYKDLYFNLWKELKRTSFNLEFYKDSIFKQMSVLSCNFWD